MLFALPKVYRDRFEVDLQLPGRSSARESNGLERTRTASLPYRLDVGERSRVPEEPNRARPPHHHLAVRQTPPAWHTCASSSRPHGDDQGTFSVRLHPASRLRVRFSPTAAFASLLIFVSAIHLSQLISVPPCRYFRPQVIYGTCKCRAGTRARSVRTDRAAGPSIQGLRASGERVGPSFTADAGSKTAHRAPSGAPIEGFVAGRIPTAGDRCFRSLEAHFGVSAVAERLVGGCAAAARRTNAFRLVRRAI